MEPAVSLVNEAGLFHSLIQEGGPRNHGLSISVPRGTCCANLERTLNIELVSIGLFDLLDHLFFSFSAPVSRGAQKGEWSRVCGIARPRAAFCAKKLRFCASLVTRHWSLATALKCPPCRQRAGVFPISPCPRENGCRKGQWDENNSSRKRESRQFQVNKLGDLYIMVEGLPTTRYT